MSIFDRGPKVRAEIAALRSERDAARSTVQAQALIIDDIESVQEAGTKYIGNEYTSYKSAIDEIAKKYSGTAEWGCQPTGNIIDTRAAFIIGQGVQVSPVEGKEAKNETEFIKKFFDFNDLDCEMAQEFAKEVEIEGCFLGLLSWDKKNNQVALRFMSRVDKSYTVIHPSGDYAWYQRVKYTDEGDPTTKYIEEPGFVYARFGGRIHKINEPFPKVAKCLTEIEGLSKALRDWREINRLFAAPIPHIECDTADQAKYMSTAMSAVAKNWKVRKLFAHTGRLSYASPDLTGAEMIEKEILTLAKIISGTTGVPIGFMGFGDLTTKLGSGSEITSSQIESAISKEREIWKGTYQQIIQKAMAIYSAESGMRPLDPSVIEVTLPMVTETTWSRIKDIWLPLFIGGAIELGTMLSQIPGIDVETEVKAKEERAAQAAEQFTRSGRDDEDEDPDDAGDKGNSKEPKR